MERSIERVVRLLTEINEAYTHMVSLSEEKRDGIIRGDAPTVGETVKKEWALLKKIEGLEERRLKAMTQTLREWNMPDGETTLAGLMDRADADMRERILRAGEELKGTIAIQRDLNDQNTALLNLHFAYMDFLMGNFMGDDAGGGIYGHSGAIRESSAGSAGILDSHV